LIISKKAQLPNNAKKLKENFNLTEEELKLAFTLPHTIAYESYVKAFQYKILNLILYTNTKFSKLDTVSTINVLFAVANQKLYTTSFFTVPTQIYFRKVLKNTTLH
jgi:hypothetical protein